MFLDNEATWPVGFKEAGERGADYDPVKRRAFELEAQLCGSLRMFTIRMEDPEEVAAAINPVTRADYAEEAYAALSWLEDFQRAMKKHNG